MYSTSRAGKVDLQFRALFALAELGVVPSIHNHLQSSSMGQEALFRYQRAHACMWHPPYRQLQHIHINLENKAS